MHEFSELDVKIPEFLVKLWKLVDDSNTDDLIRWSDNGKFFVIVKPIEFTTRLLPLNFKHGNMASFNRQLNMYGFQKINHILDKKLSKDSMVFAHPCFVKGHPYLLENIKRKKAVNRSAAPLFSFVKENVVGNDKQDVQAELLSQVLLDINTLKSKQSNWDAKLSNMKRENEALWKELAIFRQKHVKQEQIINKLIHFIVTMVRPSSRNVSIRRRYPLMINDIERSDSTAGPSSANATIKELDPLDAFLIDSGSTLTGDDRTVPLINLQCSEDQAQPSSSRSFKDSTPYFVSSPEMIEPESKLSKWAQIEDYDEAAMTPINPSQACSLTYDDPSVDRSTVLQSDTTPRDTTFKSPSNVIALKGKIKANVNQDKKTKKTSGKKTKTTRNEAKNNIIQEALDMLDDSELDLEEIKSPQPDLIQPSNDEADFLNIIKIPQPSTSSAVSAGNNTISIPEEPIGDDSLAVVQTKTGYSDDFHDNEDVARYDSIPGLSAHVDLVQGDIDVLKELLKNDTYSIDANTLLELFSEDPMNFVMSNKSEDEPAKNNVDGNELMAYSPPNLVDLMEAYSFPLGTPDPAEQISSPPPSPSILETPVATPASSPFIQTGSKRRKV